MALATRKGWCRTRRVRKRPLGKTGLEVTELCLGTWGLSGDAYGPVREADMDRVVERALTLGVRLFDTADVYGRGDMERRLGRMLPTEARVVTKLGTDLDSSPPRKRFDRPYLREALDRSRERLRRDKVDVVLLHNPSESAVVRGEACEALRELAAEGALEVWGVSAGDTSVARAALEKGAQVLELPVNLTCAANLAELAGPLTARGCGVLARSVLAHGLLSGYWSGDREFYPGDHRLERWTRDELRLRLRQLDTARDLIAPPVPSLRALALRYVLDQALVSSAVLGPRSLVQLDQLVREAGHGPPYLDPALVGRLASRLAPLGVVLP